MRALPAFLLVLLALGCAQTPPQEAPKEPASERALFACEDPRPESCSQLHDPVCGDDGQAYANPCTACANPLIGRYGKSGCGLSDSAAPAGAVLCGQERPGGCVAIDDAVCGSDGRQYQNSCAACANLSVSWHTVGAC